MRGSRFSLFFAFALTLLAGFELYQVVTESTGFTSFAANALFKNNLHAVVEREFYRSAEMSPEELRRTIKDLGLKTVLDVRLGTKGSEGGADSEASIVANAGANYRHFPLKGSEVMAREQLEELIGVLDSAERPILVHCSSGTHRSGLVSALYLIAEKNVEPVAASEQLSAKYGFFRFEREIKSSIQGHPTIDNVLWSYLEHVKAQQGRGGDTSLRGWISSLPTPAPN